MINSDAFLMAIFLVGLVNAFRYISTLRSLLAVMRECDPLLYQQVDGRGFFKSQGNVTKQIRLFHYIRSHQYQNHHDPLFIQKCIKVRKLFVLASVFVLLFFVCIIAIAVMGW